MKLTARAIRVLAMWRLASSSLARSSLAIFMSSINSMMSLLLVMSSEEKTARGACESTKEAKSLPAPMSA